MTHLKVGDIVVYLRGGSLTELGKARKGIWVVKALEFRGLGLSTVTLASLADKDKAFVTDSENCVEMEYIRAKGLAKKGSFSPKSWELYQNMINPCSEIYLRSDNTTPTFTTEYGNETMNRNNDMVKRATDANVSAAKVAATITAGKTLNKLVASKVTPQLPMFVKGYADTVVGRVVMANLADFAVKQFMPNNAKALMASEAMMQAAMLDLADSFDLEGMVTEMVNSVSLDLPSDPTDV